jgi:Flp pilus assembly protein TadD
MNNIKSISVVMVILGIMFFSSLPASADSRPSPSLKEGIELYNQENYEEAILTLIKAREEDPTSADAAFYLGMAYRQANDIENAFRQFGDAVTLKPVSDNAILELIESATLLDKFDTAYKWIAVAEEHKVYPARVAFLKGTALAKQARYAEAVAAFEQCKQLDPAYTQSADLQIGVCYMNQRKFKLARDRFQAAVTQDPLSDMASYARRYQEAAEQWQYIERPLRLTVGIMGQYDTNYRTLADTYSGAPAVMNAYLESQNRESMVMQNMARLDYVPTLRAPFVFNAGYAVANALHQRYGTSNDTFSNSFTLAPGLAYENYAVNLIANYTHNLKREPGYQRYSESASIGPLYRRLLSNNRIIEAGLSFVKKNYFQAVPDPANEDQSSKGWNASLNWVWFFRENALLNTKFDYTKENAEGRNYDNQGYHLSAGVIYPLREKLRLQGGLDFNFQNYDNENLIYDNTIRKDRIYTTTIGLTWSLTKQADLIVQHLFTRANSNIYAYDYKREIYSLGIELKF